VRRCAQRDDEARRIAANIAKLILMTQCAELCAG
jgi:hypothetical protein